MIELIRQRLISYKAASAVEEEQATKEILQEVALYLLWRGGFFEKAAFQGGTSLRILYELPRFSEDLDFPLDFEVCHQDLPSNFALKLHALLCRPYLKGRDWYDFNWSTKQRIEPNLPHLQAALDQFGPWKGKVPELDRQWLADRLKEKIATIDWKTAAADVERFLGPTERASLTLWSERFFNSKVATLLDSRSC